MKVIKSELTAYFDCDDTLVLYQEQKEGDKDEDFVHLNFYGEEKKLKIHKEHISFLKALKARGYTIFVWSGNGHKWAEEVCKRLKLTPFVDFATGKPTKVIDDLDASHWMRTIYITKDHI